MKTLLNMTLSQIYLDYVNNFVTIGVMAEHYEVDCDFMMSLYENARNLYCTVYDPK
jgi:hypothetical protein